MTPRVPRLVHDFARLTALYSQLQQKQIARIVGEQPTTYSLIINGKRRLTLDKARDWMTRWNAWAEMQAPQVARLRLVVDSEVGGLWEVDMTIELSLFGIAHPVTTAKEAHLILQLLQQLPRPTLRKWSAEQHVDAMIRARHAVLMLSGEGHNVDWLYNPGY